MSNGASLSQPPDLTADVFQAMLEKSSLRVGQIAMLGVLAGIYIGFGGLFATIALAGADGVLPYGVAQILAGLVFATGLILVVIAGAELFTGNLLMAGSVAARSVPISKAIAALLVVYLGNFAGSILLAGVVLAAGLHLAEGGAIAKVALDIASTKTSHGFVAAMASGVLANMLVCLAVWLSYSAASTTDKVAAVILPIAAFVAAGFEHSVANMYLLSYAWMIPDTSSTGISISAIAGNLVPATIGNIIGGSSVALAYWWSYCRDAK
jgi:formate transporter